MYSENLEFTTYWKDIPTCHVVVKGNDIKFENFTDNPLQLPFGVRTEAEVDREYLESVFEDRCFPRERANCNDILRRLGLDCYEPELICRKTHGQQFDDFCWIQFADEPQVTYDEIKLR